MNVVDDGDDDGDGANVLSVCWLMMITTITGCHDDSDDDYGVVVIMRILMTMMI